MSNGILGVGFAAQRFLTEALPGWPLRAGALGYFCAAGWRDHTVRRRLATAEVRLMPRALTLGLALLLAAVAALAAATLWRV
ncbi:hypothetical protein R1A27_32965 (plasmid) [Methylobacterium sp. NMS12]|uniref:hypothetical protein n=1 Tax=Methylobacterium sp. NMS12 TaxID=3079766 RepID=UPI003F882767